MQFAPFFLPCFPKRLFYLISSLLSEIITKLAFLLQRGKFRIMDIAAYNPAIRMAILYLSPSVILNEVKISSLNSGQALLGMTSCTCLLAGLILS